MSFTLTVESRGKAAAKPKTIRKRGFVPAVLYGPEIKNQSIQVDRRQFLKTFSKAGETQVIDLVVDGKDTVPVLVQDFQRDPVSGMVTHIDFMQISMKRAITTEVPLKFVGVAPAVKELGGVFLTNLRNVEVKGLPQAIPPVIEVDISSLKAFYEEILVGDIAVPEDVEVLTSKELSVASILPPRTLKELTSLDEEVEEDIESVESSKPLKEAEGEESAETEENGAVPQGKKPSADAGKEFKEGAKSAKA